MNPDYNPYEYLPVSMILFIIDGIGLITVWMILYLRTPSSLTVPVDEGGDEPLPTKHTIPLDFLIGKLCLIGLALTVPNVILYVFYIWGLKESSYALIGAELACQAQSYILAPILNYIFLLITATLLVTATWQAELQFKMAAAASRHLTVPAENAPTEANPAKLVILPIGSGGSAVGFIEKFAANVEEMTPSGSGLASPLHGRGAPTSEKKRSFGLGSSLVTTVLCDAFGTQLCPTSDGLAKYNLRQDYKKAGYNLTFDGDEPKKSCSLSPASNVQLRYTDFVTLPFADASVDVLLMPRGTSIKYLRALPPKKHEPVSAEELGRKEEEKRAGVDDRVRKTEALMKEVYRVLKPRGRLVLLTREPVLGQERAAITAPKTQLYRFCSLTPKAESPGEPDVDVSEERFRISVIKARVMGCVKHELHRRGGSPTDTDTSVQQAELATRHSTTFQSSSVKEMNANLAKLNVCMPQWGSLWVQCFSYVLLQVIFLVAYVWVGLVYGDEMCAPKWVPWSQNVLNFYFSNTNIFPILVAVNYDEYCDFMYSKTLAAIQAGLPAASVNNAENMKLVNGILYFQAVDMFLLFTIFNGVYWLPGFVGDVILMKGFGVSASAANTYNIFFSLVVMAFLYRLCWTPALAWYTKFTESRNNQENAIEPTAQKRELEGHSSFDKL